MDFCRNMLCVLGFGKLKLIVEGIIYPVRGNYNFPALNLHFTSSSCVAYLSFLHGYNMQFLKFAESYFLA